MALTKRQKKFYTDTVDVWKGPGATGVPLPTDGNDVVTNIIYNPLGAPDQTAVKCMLQTQLEGNELRRPIGRSAFDNIFTLDRLHLEVGTDIGDQDVVKITTPGHPLLNQYFICQGEGRERESRSGRRGNYMYVQLKRTNAPVVQDLTKFEFGLGFDTSFDS